MYLPHFYYTGVYLEDDDDNDPDVTFIVAEAPKSPEPHINDPEPLPSMASETPSKVTRKKATEYAQTKGKYDVLSSLQRRDSPCSALRKQETKGQSVFQISIYNAVDV